MKPTSHYTAIDIERYHSGRLSAAEMHALEKAALDDPFLADALEGYVHTQTPAADLASLQQRLQLRIDKEEKKKPVFFLGNQWMKIAALFILFAGGGWLVFQTLSTNNKTDIATVETTDKKLPSIISKPATDTPAASSNSPETTEVLPLPETKKKQYRSEKTLDERNTVATATVASPAPNQQPSKFEARQQNDFEEPKALGRSGYVDSAVKSNPEAFAKEKTAARKSATDTIKNFDVVMQRTEVALDEVVVINKNKASVPAKRRMQVVVDTLEPAEGWMQFNDYIADNLKMPDELKTKQTKGEVELAFEVNKQGEPVNITVVKSLCEKCDEEAIRLLKEGPKWKKQTKKKGKVKIKF